MSKPPPQRPGLRLALVLSLPVLALVACNQSLTSLTRRTTSSIGVPLPSHTKPMVLKSASLGKATHDGLWEVARPVPKRVYVRPDHDFRRYNRILLEPLQISVDYASRNEGRDHAYGSSARFELDERGLERLRELFAQEMSQALAGGPRFRLVDRPGPDVLRMSTLVVELTLNAPTEKSRNIQAIHYTGATSAMTLMVEWRDSLTGEVLLRVGDHQVGKADFDRNTDNAVWNDARFMFLSWGNLFRRRLEVLCRQGTLTVPEA